MRSMKKSLLIKLHLYTGLFTSFYLVAFGVSTLIMNHKVQVERKELAKEWKATVSNVSGLPDLEKAQTIRDELGIMGWIPRWKFKSEKTLFHFSVTHPGRSYEFSYNSSTSEVHLREFPKGFVAVFHGLHFLNGKIPNAPLLIRSWAIYQWLALFMMLISLVLGIWLWLKFSYRQWQGIVFGGLFLCTLILMMLL